MEDIKDTADKIRQIHRKICWILFILWFSWSFLQPSSTEEVVVKEMVFNGTDKIEITKTHIIERDVPYWITSIDKALMLLTLAFSCYYFYKYYYLADKLKREQEDKK